MNEIQTACLYLRYSSAAQTEQSIEGQMRVCREYCQRNNIAIAEVYIDRATSASHDLAKRTNFLRMISDAEKHKFDAVIVYKLDRFARNRYDSATYKAKLKKHGVRLISATEQLSDTPESIILESVLEGMAEFYSAELSQKIKRGMRESAVKHNAVGGHTPLGYKIVDKQYVVDESTAPIVQEAFRRYAAGDRLIDICESFNARGFKTAKGAKFSKSSFHVMFTNRRYIGSYVFKGEETPGVIPPLIDVDTFERVQQKMQANKRYPGSQKAKEPYLLLGKLVCGHCNDLMIGDGGTGKSGQQYHYYVCRTRKKNKRCDKRPIPKDWIENLVVNDAKTMLTDEFIDEMAKAAVEENQRINEENATVKALQAQIDTCSTSLRRLAKAIETAEIIPETIITRMGELEKEKAHAQKELDRALKETITLTEDQVRFWLEGFKTGDFDDPDFRRKLVDLLIISVIVWDEPDGFRITTNYNLSATKTKAITAADILCSDIECYAPLIQAYTNTTVYVCMTRRETA